MAIHVKVIRSVHAFVLSDRNSAQHDTKRTDADRTEPSVRQPQLWEAGDVAHGGKNNRVGSVTKR